MSKDKYGNTKKGYAGLMIYYALLILILGIVMVGSVILGILTGAVFFWLSFCLIAYWASYDDLST
jgi:hypothetical protein